jgi:acetoin utilization protein AcuB
MKQRVPVSQIMSKALIVITPNKKVSEAYNLFEEYNIRHIPVVSGTKLVGVISKNDLAKVGFISQEMSKEVVLSLYETHEVKDIMTSNPVSVTADAYIKDVAELLANHSFHSVPVLDKDEIVGIITTKDLINYLVDQY